MEDDIDIYEDLPSFEAKQGENAPVSSEREETVREHEELKRRIAELTTELEDSRKVNKNFEVNLSSLLKTAKAEIARKDRMIEDLRRQLDDASFRRGTNARAIVQAPREVNVPRFVSKERCRSTDSLSCERQSVAASRIIVSSANQNEERIVPNESIAAPITVFGERLRKRIGIESTTGKTEIRLSNLDDEANFVESSVEAYVAESDKENGSCLTYAPPAESKEIPCRPITTLESRLAEEKETDSTLPRPTTKGHEKRPIEEMGDTKSSAKRRKTSREMRSAERTNRDEHTRYEFVPEDTVSDSSLPRGCSQLFERHRFCVNAGLAVEEEGKQQQHRRRYSSLAGELGKKEGANGTREESSDTSACNRRIVNERDRKHWVESGGDRTRFRIVGERWMDSNAECPKNAKRDDRRRNERRKERRTDERTFDRHFVARSASYTTRFRRERRERSKFEEHGNYGEWYVRRRDAKSRDDAERPAKFLGEDSYDLEISIKERTLRLLETEGAAGTTNRLMGTHRDERQRPRNVIESSRREKRSSPLETGQDAIAKIAPNEFDQRLDTTVERYSDPKFDDPPRPSLDVLEDGEIPTTLYRSSDANERPKRPRTPQKSNETSSRSSKSPTSGVVMSHEKCKANLKPLESTDPALCAFPAILNNGTSMPPSECRTIQKPPNDTIVENIETIEQFIRDYGPRKQLSVVEAENSVGKTDITEFSVSESIVAEKQEESELRSEADISHATNNLLSESFIGTDNGKCINGEEKATPTESLRVDKDSSVVDQVEMLEHSPRDNRSKEMTFDESSKDSAAKAHLIGSNGCSSEGNGNERNGDIDGNSKKKEEADRRATSIPKEDENDRRDNPRDDSERTDEIRAKKKISTISKNSPVNVVGKIVVFARRRKPVHLVDNDANMTIVVQRIADSSIETVVSSTESNSASKPRACKLPRHYKDA